MKLVRLSVDLALYDDVEGFVQTSLVKDVENVLMGLDNGEPLTVTVEDSRDHPFPDPVIRNPGNDPELQREDERALEAWIGEARRVCLGDESAEPRAGETHSMKEPTAVHIMVMMAGKPDGLGVQSYRVMPRIGEMLEVADESKKAQMFRVVAVHHPAEPTSAAAELYVEHVGTTTEEIGRLVSAHV